MRFKAVDAQGFTGRSGEFVIKEIAFCDNSAQDVRKFFLQPPYPFMCLSHFRRNAALYARARVHGLNWNDGTVPYEQGLELIKAYVDKNMLYYCKGEEKALALSKILDVPVYNIERFLNEADAQGYFVYQNERADCGIHDRSEVDPYLKCASKQAYCVRTLMREFFEPLSSRFTVSYLDMNHTDCRLESFRQIRSVLSTSPVALHLAHIGYYLIGEVMHCQYCKESSETWQAEGVVLPKNIAHFHRVCPSMPK